MIKVDILDNDLFLVRITGEANARLFAGGQRYLPPDTLHLLIAEGLGVPVDDPDIQPIDDGIPF